MSVLFTQYLRPNGKRAEIHIQRPEKVEIMAKEIMEAGYKFECEELMGGICSFTVASPHENEGDIVIKLCRNGPNVPDTIDLVIREAHTKVMNRRAPHRNHKKK